VDIGPFIANIEAAFSIYLGRPIDPAVLATINVGGIALLIPALLEARIGSGQGSIKVHTPTPEQIHSVLKLHLFLDALGASVVVAGISCLVSMLLLALHRPETDGIDAASGPSPLLVLASNTTTIGIVAAVVLFLALYVRAQFYGQRLK